MLVVFDLVVMVEDELVLLFIVVVVCLVDVVDVVLVVVLCVVEVSVCGEYLLLCLVVIVMGKCGVCELNYVSDVDVIFVVECFDLCNVCVVSEMMWVVLVVFFEVDVVLCLEGCNGELVCMFELYIVYYQCWVKIWEFQVLLKVWLVVGDVEFGECYLIVLMLMVW